MPKTTVKEPSKYLSKAKILLGVFILTPPSYYSINYMKVNIMSNVKKRPLKKEDADPLMEELRSKYKAWRENTKAEKQGFFVIYNSFIKNNLLKDISGNALKLYLYLGFNSKNETGESWHSVDKIADYFECDKRSVKRWFEELEKLGLVERIQKGYHRIANTFLKPY